MLKNRIYKLLLIRSIFKPLIFLINKIIQILDFYIIWRSGKAIGDQVLMAGFAKALQVENKNRVIVLTNYPEILSLSPWIFKTISIKKILFWSLLYYFLKIIEGERVIEYNFPYTKYGFKSHLIAYRSGFYDLLKEPPIWHAHVADRFDKEIFKKFSGGLKISNNKDAFIIINKIRLKHSKCKVGIINPNGKNSYTKVKMYGFRNYQQVINYTQKKIKWIQIGKKNEKKLKNIHLDLRGNSLSFLVDIIAFSDLVLSDEGLLNHIAGSFPNVNSYVSYSEFSPSKYYSYQNTFTVGKPENAKNISFWRETSRSKSEKKDPFIIAKEILNNEFKNLN